MPIARMPFLGSGKPLFYAPLFRAFEIDGKSAVDVAIAIRASMAS